MIEFRNVSFAHGKKKILDNVSFTCDKGKITSIIGRNGAGKTSALKCLVGINAYSGKILYKGNDIRKIPPAMRAKTISYFPQILPNAPFTVYELASLGRRPYQTRIGKLTEEDREQIERALEASDMRAFSERRVDTLSGGERQRAYLSMILAQNTDIIALDEPAAYMDASVEGEMHALLRKLCTDTGKTIIEAIHNLTRAVNDTDKIVVFKEGSVILESDAESIRNGKDIEEIFSVKKGVFLSNDGEKRIAYL
ncbi:MAG: ABC transporter ATP-binding protein [Clostridia bacterium]|nr:ABC transporter ATP-binding protein [Clostridia bacterium]